MIYARYYDIALINYFSYIRSNDNFEN